MRRLALLAALALGCAHAPEAPRGPVLTFYTSLGQAEWVVLRREVFAPFERAHGCTVRAFEVASSDMPRKLDALRRGGHMDVDVIGQDNMALAVLVARGLVDDLTDLEPTIPRETSPALRALGVFGGRRYFMPYRPNVEIAFYHAGHLARHGLKPPRTWPELLAVARALRAAEGVGRVAIKADGSGGTTVHLFDFIHAAGGDPMALDDAGSRTAFRFLRELWPFLSPESRRADVNTMNQFLATESVYLGQNWPFAIEVLVRQGEKAEIRAYPGWRGPVREAHTLGGEVLGIPKGAPHRALAAAFIAHVESQAAQRALVRELGWPPMREDAYAAVAPWQAPFFAAVRVAMKAAIARPNVRHWEAVDKALNAAFREIVVEGADVDATLRARAADLRAARVKG